MKLFQDYRKLFSIIIFTILIIPLAFSHAQTAGDLKNKKLNTDIAVTDKKIDKTNLKIESLSSDISTKQDTITNNVESIKLEIRKTNEFEMNSILSTLLSENDFTVIWNDIDNIATVREKIRQDIVKLKEIKGELEDTRKETIISFSLTMS